MSRPLCGSEPTHHPAPPTPGARAWTGSQCYGGDGGRETPGHIPNPEAKPLSADGTAPGTGWESRTPPDNHSPNGAPADRLRAPFGMSAPFDEPHVPRTRRPMGGPATCARRRTPVG